jgi:hypothetical protein
MPRRSQGVCIGLERRFLIGLDAQDIMYRLDVMRTVGGYAVVHGATFQVADCRATRRHAWRRNIRLSHGQYGRTKRQAEDNEV